jgi:hypothetical protein
MWFFRNSEKKKFLFNNISSEEYAQWPKVPAIRKVPASRNQDLRNLSGFPKPSFGGKVLDSCDVIEHN